MDESKDALVQLLTMAPFTVLNLRPRTSNLMQIWFTYISGSFTESQCRWPAITKEYFGIFMSFKKCSFYLWNSDLLAQF